MRRPLLAGLVCGLVLAGCADGGMAGSGSSPSATASPEPTGTETTLKASEPAPEHTTETETASPAPVATEEPLTEMQPGDAAAALGDVARAIVERWRAGDDDYTDLSKQLMQAATEVQEDHEPLEYPGSAAPISDWRYAVVWMGDYGVPGDAERGWSPTNLFPVFKRLGIEGTPSSIGSGPHEVGDVTVPTETVTPGTYEAFDVEGCYWERLDAAGKTIANNFVSAAPRVEVTIQATDYAFNSEDCGQWIEVG